MPKITRRAALVAAALAARPLRGLAAAEAKPKQPEIDADFPGGNIVVDSIDNDVVNLYPDLRDTAGFWFYWSFRIKNAGGRTLQFRFRDSAPITARGPAVSRDGGRTWSWLSAPPAPAKSFVYAFADDAEVRFAVAMPYLESNWRAFVTQLGGGSAHVQLKRLTTSAKGRDVERLHVGRLDGQARWRLLLTARHHACESMASWVLEGFVQAALAETSLGRWFRENVELVAIPFVDRDGVEDGDQGKNRQPHDHNRDYLGQSRYAEVAAIRQWAPGWADGRLRLAFDLHCPTLRGGKDRPGDNERLFFVGQPAAEQWAALTAFARILEEVQQGPLVFHGRHNIPFGTSWNNEPEPKMSARWMARIPGVQLATTLEVPYASVGDAAVTPASARALGADLAAASRKWLQRP